MGLATVYCTGFSSSAFAKLENFAGKGTLDAVFKHFETFSPPFGPLLRIKLDTQRDYLIFQIRSEEHWHELRFLWHKCVVKGCATIDPRDVHGYLMDRAFDRRASDTPLQLVSNPIAVIDPELVATTFKRWDVWGKMLLQIQRSIKYYLPMKVRLLDDLLMVEYLAEADPEKTKLP